MALNLLRESTRTFVYKMLIFVIGIFTSTVVARGLGPDGRGVLTIVFMLPALIASVGSLGIGSANVYLLGKGAYRRKQFTGNSIVLSLVLGPLYFGAVLLFLAGLERLIFRDAPRGLVLFGFLILPLTLFINFSNNGILRGLQQIREFNISALVQRLAYFLLILPLFLLGRLEVPEVMIATICGALASCLYTLAVLRRGTGLSLAFSFPLLRDSLQYGLREHVGNVAQRLNLRLDTVLLAAFLAPADIGYYTIAVLLAEFVWYVPDSIGVALFPKVATSGKEEAAATTMLTCRVTFALTLALCLFLAFFGQLVIRVLYGAGFLPAYLPLAFLLPGIVGQSMAKILTKFTSGIGKPQYNSIAAIVSFAINIPLLLALVPWMGILGASVASSTAYLVNLAVMIVLFKRQVRCGWVELFIVNKSDLRRVRSGLGPGRTGGE